VSIPSSISLVVGNRSARTREDTSLFISSIIVLISLFEYHSSCLLHKASTEVIGSTVEEAKRTRLLFWLENDICRRQGGVNYHLTSVVAWLVRCVHVVENVPTTSGSGNVKQEKMSFR
jgi:hypothetical protein